MQRKATKQVMLEHNMFLHVKSDSLQGLVNHLVLVIAKRTYVVTGMQYK